MSIVIVIKFCSQCAKEKRKKHSTNNSWKKVPLIMQSHLNGCKNVRQMACKRTPSTPPSAFASHFPSLFLGAPLQLVDANSPSHSLQYAFKACEISSPHPIEFSCYQKERVRERKRKPIRRIRHPGFAHHRSLLVRRGRLASELLEDGEVAKKTGTFMTPRYEEA